MMFCPANGQNLILKWGQMNGHSSDWRRKDADNPFNISSTCGSNILHKFQIAMQVDVNSEQSGILDISIDIVFDEKLTDYVESIVIELNKLIISDDEKTQVWMVTRENSGLNLRSFDLNIPEIDIELNYGIEWKIKHDYLLKVLGRKSKKGIALLHGIPGTGKSQYIRYLISLLSKTRTLIYLPNQLISSITDPSFLPLMANYPDSILIIEDAESAIKSRKWGGTTVDNLLNLSDGILSDFLGTQIICTFNQDISQIDEALLRKGRLILKHEFGKLSQQQAQRLSDKLGFTKKIDEDMTLTEVYNQEDEFTEDVKKSQPIGFGL